MKIKIHLIALMMLFSGLTITTQASAKENAAIATSAMSIEQQQSRAAAIKTRVDEIKAMNISEMSSAQRKEVRHELRDMNKELRSMDPTVIYISGGAIILIIILLIILL